ncbi:MAG: Lrp/AsnC family transcriptional regulator [bacterium]|nr:Lrp/AsnC family transcriptional regulator [bacterium]
MSSVSKNPFDEVDRKIVKATQKGLPLTSKPYHAIADDLGLAADEVMERMNRMLETSIIRRIGVVPNHYSLGLTANGMSVWNVPDEEISKLGAMVGALDYVSHCYHRPRFPPDWPYNLFAMVHGITRDEVESKVDKVSKLLGEADHGHEILYSKRILKKSGLRLT